MSSYSIIVSAASKLVQLQNYHSCSLLTCPVTALSFLQPLKCPVPALSSLQPLNLSSYSTIIPAASKLVQLQRYHLCRLSVLRFLCSKFSNIRSSWGCHVCLSVCLSVRLHVSCAAPPVKPGDCHYIPQGPNEERYILSAQCIYVFLIILKPGPPYTEYTDGSF